MMRFKFACLLTVPVLAVMSQSARANRIAYEGFSLTFPAYNTGAGFSGPWAQGGFEVTASGYAAGDGSLFYLNGNGNAGAKENSGDAGLLVGGGSISDATSSVINGAKRPLAQSLGADNTTVYFSFLIRPQGTLNSGVLNGFFGLTLNGSLGNDLFIGKPGGGVDTQYVPETRGGGGQIPSGTSAVVDQTALLVVKAQFLNGHDIFTLYANPVPGDSEPTSGAFESDLDLGVVSAVGIYSTADLPSMKSESARLLPT